MFGITKKIAVAASLLAIYSGQFDAFGSNINNNNNDEWYEGNQLVQRNQNAAQHSPLSQNTAAPIVGTMAKLPFGAAPGLYKIDGNVWRHIFSFAIPGTHPIDLQLVCKNWRNIMLEDNTPQPALKFLGLNPFMKSSMNIYWAEKFRNGILRYTPPQGGEVKVLKFSDLLSNYENTKGSFNLSDCGDTQEYLRMTLSVEEFLKAGGENQNKVVILFATRQMIEGLITTSAKPFADILKGWDPSCPVGVFWKWGNDDVVGPNKKFLVDYLTNQNIKQVVKENLYVNWRKSAGAACAVAGWWWCGGVCGSRFHVCLVNQNQDYRQEPATKKPRV